MQYYFLLRCKTIFCKDEGLFSVEMKNRPNCGNKDDKEKSAYPLHCTPSGGNLLLKIWKLVIGNWGLNLNIFGSRNDVGYSIAQSLSDYYPTLLM